MEGPVIRENGYDCDGLIQKGVRANVRRSVAQLWHRSEMHERMIGSEQMLVAGAQYLLETGRAEFFDD